MPPVRILYRWRGRYGLEGALARVRRADVLETLEGGWRADVLETLARVGRAVVLGHCREEQPLERKIPADLEVFGEKDYFYKKKDAQ